MEWICEQHPELDWPHGDCAGPGMPKSAQVRALVFQRDTAITERDLWEKAAELTKARAESAEAEVAKRELEVFEQKQNRKGDRVAFEQILSTFVWQPIETAPKDGTRILVVSKIGVGITVWREKANSAGDQPGWVCGYSPTRWMPLPVPPG